MRIGRVEKGQALKYRLVLGAIGAVRRHRAPDILRVLTYRPEFFGRAFSGALHEAMCAPGHFTRGERELVAAYTSRLNDCLF